MVIIDLFDKEYLGPIEDGVIVSLLDNNDLEILLHNVFYKDTVSHDTRVKILKDVVREDKGYTYRYGDKLFVIKNLVFRYTKSAGTEYILTLTNKDNKEEMLPIEIIRISYRHVVSKFYDHLKQCKIVRNKKHNVLAIKCNGIAFADKVRETGCFLDFYTFRINIDGEAKTYQIDKINKTSINLVPYKSQFNICTIDGSRLTRKSDGSVKVIYDHMMTSLHFDIILNMINDMEKNNSTIRLDGLDYVITEFTTTHKEGTIPVIIEVTLRTPNEQYD